MKKLISLMACAAILGLGFTSCDDDDEFIPDAIGDAYIKTVKIGDEVKHGLVLYTYANASIASVKVGTPDVEADSIDLASFDNSTTTFRVYPTEDADFTTEIPEVGTYGFVIETENYNSMNRTDDLTDVTVPLADLTESTLEEDEIHVKFPRIESAQAYLIRLTDEEGVTIFESLLLSNTEEEADKDYTITNSTSGWASEKNISNVKSIKLIAIIYESADHPSHYEVQAISESEKIMVQ